MNDTVEGAVRDALATVLGRPIQPGENVERAREPKWDSLLHVEILFTVEGSLGIRFTAEEMAELNSLERLVRAAQNYHAS